ncbi:MAG TPA: hypothetical protein PK970_09440 [Hyphomicrobiaceae bacterium]|nr:hypothetical protein [Hyphomicrobiaceae bacterium]
MKSFIAAGVMAFGLALAVPGANAAPLGAAPAASIDAKSGAVATEQVTFRRHKRYHRHYRHYRPYRAYRPHFYRPYYGFSYGFARPVRDCWWRHGRRVCAWRY